MARARTKKVKAYHLINLFETDDEKKGSPAKRKKAKARRAAKAKKIRTALKGKKMVRRKGGEVVALIEIDRTNGDKGSPPKRAPTTDPPEHKPGRKRDPKDELERVRPK